MRRDVLEEILSYYPSSSRRVPTMPSLSTCRLGPGRDYAVVFLVDEGPQVWRLGSDDALEGPLDAESSAPVLETFDEDFPGWRQDEFPGLYPPQNAILDESLASNAVAPSASPRYPIAPPEIPETAPMRAEATAEAEGLCLLKGVVALILVAGIVYALFHRSEPEVVVLPAAQSDG